jgi:hypothetical protein
MTNGEVHESFRFTLREIDEEISYADFLEMVSSVIAFIHPFEDMCSIKF